MPCSIKFSMTLQTEILSTDSSDFLKQIISIKSFNLVLQTDGTANSVDSGQKRFA